MTSQIKTFPQPHPHDIYGGDGGEDTDSVKLLLRSGHTIRAKLPAGTMTEIYAALTTTTWEGGPVDVGGVIELPLVTVRAAEIIGVVTVE